MKWNKKYGEPRNKALLFYSCQQKGVWLVFMESLAESKWCEAGTRQNLCLEGLSGPERNPGNKWQWTHVHPARKCIYLYVRTSQQVFTLQ